MRPAAGNQHGFRGPLAQGRQRRRPGAFYRPRQGVDDRLVVAVVRQAVAIELLRVLPAAAAFQERAVGDGDQPALVAILQQRFEGRVRVIQLAQTLVQQGLVEVRDELADAVGAHLRTGGGVRHIARAGRGERRQ